MGTALATLAPSAGAVISAIGSVASGTDWATVKVVLPVMPPWLALIVVLPWLRAVDEAVGVDAGDRRVAARPGEAAGQRQAGTVGEDAGGGEGLALAGEQSAVRSG
jgi:hypothetical protein